MVSPNQSTIEQNMINVKSITGCLIIKGSGMTSLRAFSNLEVVKYDKDLCPAYIAAILVSDNMLLRYLGMPKLRKITAGFSGMRLIFNPSVCLFEEENNRLLNTEKFVNFHVDICDPTRTYCRLDIEQGIFNEANLPTGCQVLEYVLLLNYTKPTEELQYKLNSIEEIWGALIITNTDLTSISFPKLNKIYNTACKQLDV
ncbi:hypothetical protein WR25_12956 isoform I [Diploscapter pachys]|uniref:Receptor L-domain domain-containing protein n=1 Tax=Diploscapter pachys TaxID=2018661 RepID=A0A2A2K2Z8_9BILA|nr:hypothetical protein WR25_12956 isoform C [Diploscapter pachys]PAV68314.1 hypothetical protein WR25_12956 isoform I [Diploscapter pachys]